jgi:hypothetical protein
LFFVIGKKFTYSFFIPALWKLISHDVTFFALSSFVCGDDMQLASYPLDHKQ